MKCYVCNSGDEELRPYGPKGEMICYPCMISSPEKEEQARQQFRSQLDACGDSAVIGTNVGPYPSQPKSDS